MAARAERPPIQPLAADELRRAALARSTKRGKRVAMRRLAWRWTVWGLGRAWERAWPVWIALGVVLLWFFWPSQEKPELRKPDSASVRAAAASVLGKAPVEEPAPKPAPPAPTTAEAPQAPAVVAAPAPTPAASAPTASPLDFPPGPPLILRLDDRVETPRPRPTRAKSKPPEPADISVDNRRDSRE
ncbi:hypothetical protein [Ideonella sp.]|jgi:hypothetical protein|uniref:hypothetical protein n=1 Tax=Ideonella sp. TaxID=1929293 RepID=UPI0037C0A0D1